MPTSEKDSRKDVQPSIAASPASARGDADGRQRGRKAAGDAAAELVTPNMVVGLGTGDTASHFIRALAARVRAGLSGLRCVATSLRSAELARELGLPVMDLDELPLGGDCARLPIDLTVDGADEIDPSLRLVKGAGGALLFEKLVARASRELVVVADPQKLVRRLGEKWLLPVEVVAFGARHTQCRLKALPGLSHAELRKNDATKQPYITDGCNRIVDVRIDALAPVDPASLHAACKALPGVIETGLFLTEATRAFIGHSDGSVEVLHRPPL
jgi:ribose 5-phosphate isomerase A